MTLSEGALTALIIVGLSYAVFLLFAFFLAEHVIFQPPAAGPRDERVRMLETADGAEIAALHAPNDSAEFTILYSHGNAEDLSDVGERIRRWRELGFAVLAYDYRGYGGTPGRATVEGAYRDLDAAYAYLTDELGVEPEDVIVYGRSVGGGPSVDLAAREPVGSLVIESSFTTAFRVVTRIPMLPFDRFANIAKIGAVDCPVLVIHGTADRIVPFGHGRDLFEAAPEPRRKLWVPDAGHNDLLQVAGEDYDRALARFAALISDARR